jgi:nucleoid DNA-binding protein
VLRIKIIEKMKRKLKPARLRKTTEHIKIGELAKEVSVRTGFTAVDIKTVLRTSIDVMIEQMKKGTGIVLPKIGMLYSMITAPKASMRMNGGVGEPTKMITPARRVAKFRPGKFIKQELLNQEPTPEEIDSLYED